VIAAACVGCVAAVSAMAPPTAKNIRRRLIPLFGRSIRSSSLCAIAGAGNVQPNFIPQIGEDNAGKTNVLQGLDEMFAAAVQSVDDAGTEQIAN
jgi:hypothetical protein